MKIGCWLTDLLMTQLIGDFSSQLSLKDMNLVFKWRRLGKDIPERRNIMIKGIDVKKPMGHFKDQCCWSVNCRSWLMGDEAPFLMFFSSVTLSSISSCEVNVYPLMTQRYITSSVHIPASGSCTLFPGPCLGLLSNLILLHPITEVNKMETVPDISLP